jgi:hypothetical protein
MQTACVGDMREIEPFRECSRFGIAAKELAKSPLDSRNAACLFDPP